MKQVLLIFSIFFSLQLSAQEFVEVSYGTSYFSQTFYNLNDDSKRTFDNDSWDIAFTNIGGGDAGIHINEAITASGTELELYLAPTNDFDDVVETSGLTYRLYNDEKSWQYGAFNLNELRNQMNPLDYGWGTYDPSNHMVVGDEVFVLKLKNGQFKKFMITSLSGGSYNIQWADLDGANLVTNSISKQSNPDADLILFSVQDNEVVSGLEPFDLLFTRYITPLPDGQGDTLDYTVTGVFSGIGIEVAEARGIDPETVQFEDWQEELSSELDIIGQDWKYFDLTNFVWELDDALAFFVVDQNDVVWKVVMVDFEGSSTGNAVFTKENLGMITAVEELAEVSGLKVYPNPSNGHMTLILDLDEDFQGDIRLMDMTGKTVYQQPTSLSSGLINVNIDAGHLQAGQYVLVLSSENGLAQLPILIN